MDYWIYFFMRANGWKHLPKDACIPEIQEAMTVLESFADDPEKYAYYQSRNQIQMAEISTENEHRRIREQFEQGERDKALAFEQRDDAINKLDDANNKLDEAITKLNELVIKLLAANTLTVKQISEMTGMSIEEINKIKV